MLRRSWRNFKLNANTRKLILMEENIMDKLIAKEVEFNGDILRAAQDPDGNIWVGAR